MRIICGLGNPGSEYARHRHNVGFMVCERLAARARASFTQEKFEARLAQATIAGERALLIEPQTFMNLSGRSLGGAARFYKVPPEEVLVVHDELDLPFGKLQLKAGGGAGGHNGLLSIAESWGEQGYGRLRFGIGKPEGPNAKERVVGHVLGNFSGEEAPALGGLIDAACEMAEGWARLGMQKAMNQFNRRA
ncbi:MAG: aminoacyl-tRNA hydrolase [Archangiaceae bacterium]|nr:aminoacyl-tRNA hydrolase [Archangiaceae bacterium]